MPEFSSIKTMLQSSPSDTTIHTVQGWVRTFRSQRFLMLNDGSCLSSLQIVIPDNLLDSGILAQISTGASVKVKGRLVSSQGQKQSVELLAQDLEILGISAEDYPLQPKKHSLEFLRENAHLRVRTNTFSAVFRIRHQLSYAIHNFFYQKGFYYWHTPILTASDAEGAGEMFRVTSLNLNNLPKDAAGLVDLRRDFFGCEAHLTVSGQLEGELGAMGLGKIYTFGPTFRSENSNTSRHLAEFWMIEPEMAFYDLNDTIKLADEFLRYCISFVLENCSEDMAFLDQRAKEETKQLPQDQRGMGLLEKLQDFLSKKLQIISYTEAIEILEQTILKKPKYFQYPIRWGSDLQSEHERFLAEKYFSQPLAITNYPKAIKAFYMRENEDQKTVAAVDIIFQGIGEIIGGSQREEREEKLLARMQELNLPHQELDWYLATRHYGTCIHSGFGLGLERLVMYCTGMGNIRDVIPFPRTPKQIKF